MHADVMQPCEDGAEALAIASICCGLRAVPEVETERLAHSDLSRRASLCVFSAWPVSLTASDSNVRVHGPFHVNLNVHGSAPIVGAVTRQKRRP